MAPRVQGTGVDIGAFEATDPPLTFATPEEEIAYQLQLQLQMGLEEEEIRTRQLPRFRIR